MTSASTAVKRLNSESLQQKALSELKQDALELGLSKEAVKQFGNLSHKATWLAAINDAIGREFETAPGDDSVQNQEEIANIETVSTQFDNIAVTVIQSDIDATEIACLIDHPALCEGELLGLAPDSDYLGKDDRGLPTHWALFDDDQDKVDIYSLEPTAPIPPILTIENIDKLLTAEPSATPIRDQLLLKMMDKGLSLSDLEQLQSEPLDEDTATVFLTLLEESGRMLSEALAA